jgi:hypothetical protein
MHRAYGSWVYTQYLLGRNKFLPYNMGEPMALKSGDFFLNTT